MEIEFRGFSSSNLCIVLVLSTILGYLLKNPNDEVKKVDISKLIKSLNLKGVVWTL